MQKMFPKAAVKRMDADVMQRKESYRETLGAFRAGKIDILVGTQMIAKGLHFPNVTLVGIVNADMGLHIPDFRASERTFQLLTQVAGRAGRAGKCGDVWLQTHHPDHPLLNTLISGGYHAFAEAELEQRQTAGFPPFAHLALLRAEAQHVDAAQQFLQAAKRALRAHDATLEMHGPLPAPMPRRAGLHRVQLLLSSLERRALLSSYGAEIVLTAKARARGTVTRRDSDGRYAFVDAAFEGVVSFDPRPVAAAVAELLAKAERDCFVGNSLTVTPVYEWTVTLKAAEMEPGDVLDISSEVSAPPQNPATVRLTFTNPRNGASGAPAGTV